MKRTVKRKRKSLKQKFGYQEGGNPVDPLGYLDSNRDAYSPYKIIPSNEITMNGVSQNVVAFPFTNEGKSLGQQMMKPGEEFKFDEADYVVEVPEVELKKFNLGGYKRYQTGGNPLNVGGDVTQQQWYDITRQLNNPSLQLDSINEFSEDVSPNEKLNIDTQLSNPLMQDDFGLQPLPNISSSYLPNVDNISRSKILSNQGIQQNNTGAVVDNPAVQIAQAQQEQLQEQVVQPTPTSQAATSNSSLSQINTKSTTSNDINPMSSAGELQLPENGNVDLLNPYGGFDIPTAASVAGQGIEEGNVGKTIAGASKFLVGSARNFLSGMAGAKRNKFVMQEAQQKEKDGLIREETLQDGGQLTTEDVNSINAGLEFQFSEDAANSLFGKRQPAQAPETYQPNLGKYGEVGYFNVGDVQGNAITLDTTVRNPHNASTMKQLIPSLKKMNPGKEIRINYIPKAQDGGKLNQILTDGYVQGIDNQNFMQPNAEVESGEYIDSEGESVKEVIGKKHSEGGELMNLDGEDRILSDHLKIGGANAKHLRDLYDLDVKASNTYSTVLDKFKSKSGLNKILKEKEDIISKIEKQKDVEDESTAGLNAQFLSGKLKELDEKQQPLQVQMKELFNETFLLQESKKSREEQSNEVFELGGQKFNSDQIIAIGKKYNLSPDEAKEYFQEFKKGGYKKYQDGGFGTKGVGLKEVPEGQSQDDSTGLFGEVDKSSFEETILKNPWFEWRGFDPNNPQDVLRFQQQFNKMSTDGQQIREDGKFGEQTQSVQLDFSRMQPIVKKDFIIESNQLDPLEPIADLPEKELEEVEKENRRDAILLPDQYPLPPDSLQPHLKNQRRFDRLDPNLISPEQQIEEINRNRNQVQKQLNQLPDNQRRAALASLNANTNNQLNSAISEVNKVNSQIKTQTDRVNLQQSNMEENFLATDALDFERRQLTALAKTQNDIRNYFNQLRRVQVGNFNTINNLNLLNDLNDDFQFTSNGIEKNTSNPVFTSDAVKRAQAGIPSLSTTPITSVKKKHGGKAKKRRVRRKK